MPAHFQEFVWRIVRNKLFVFAAIFLPLRLEGEGSGASESMGSSRRSISGGLLFGVAMFIALNVVLGSVLSSSSLGWRRVDPRSCRSSRSRRIGWPGYRSGFWGGVVEELQRIFIFTRFENWLGRPGLVLGIVLSSVMFGLGHRYQGLGIAIGTEIGRAALAPLSAPALRARAHHRTRVQRCPRHAGATMLAK